ncbi:MULTISPECIES: energy-coupling factor transporter transmembrane component T [unclassified Campylobacter]|uniref:energy-coupling factor transporter transmembrane component T n=1 Tax=unclassified Campylobacter TaxID=2593542 RepID=UPI002FDC566B
MKTFNPCQNAAISLLCFVIYSFFVALGGKIYLSYFLPVLALLALNFADFKEIFKKLAILNIFVFFMILSALIAQNSHFALLVFFRANLIMLFAILIFWKRDEYFLARGVRNLGLGDKISSIFYFCVKFIAFLRAELERQKTVLLVRGFRAKSSIFSYKTYANCVALLILGALGRAENLQNALITRGFSGKFFFAKEKFGALEIGFLFFVLICLFVRLGEMI